ncbi:S24/S26 family peptidase [Bacteroides sp. ET71]|uniref:S24/S26 family peptidase n=1 Tax=Bacteroides sp. ET71 TaxID=2939421 RepID=UPI002011089C|nr:S24/S26 family peptidase [Bacteroides sp. ET71]MCL1615008.1 S24/S26 family peptidase [Bacteroides sp. ET71]
MTMKRLVLNNAFLGEAAEALRAGRQVTVRIDGGSMYPFIRGGRDVVVLLPCPQKEVLQDGCCYFFSWKGQYMVHRFVGTDGAHCLFMGDGNIVRQERVERSEVVGILRYIVRPGGRTIDCLSPSWLRRGRDWYRWRFLRRWLLPLCRILKI